MKRAAWFVILFVVAMVGCKAKPKEAKKEEYTVVSAVGDPQEAHKRGNCSTFAEKTNGKYVLVLLECKNEVRKQKWYVVGI
mgnify:CR=1